MGILMLEYVKWHWLRIICCLKARGEHLGRRNPTTSNNWSPQVTGVMSTVLAEQRISETSIPGRYPILAESFYGLNGKSLLHFPELTWPLKIDLWKFGDSYWKPSFVEAMLVSGVVHFPQKFRMKLWTMNFCWWTKWLDLATRLDSFG